MNWWPFKRSEPAKPYQYSFAPGNLVRLKSGGPLMTVAFEVSPKASSYTGVNIGVHCSWFVDDVAHTVAFWPSQLEKADT